jgi:hypothetical protein
VRCGSGFASGESPTRNFAASVRFLPIQPTFCCTELNLILEFDGVEHFTEGEQLARLCAR